jgi:hypothetical protein
MKLITLLKELMASTHYYDRKAERGKILNIEVPPGAAKGYSIAELKPKLTQAIIQALNSRLQRLEASDINSSNTFVIGYKILKPILVNGGNEYPIEMFAEYTVYDKETKKPKGKKMTSGTYYYGVINNNVFVTILLENAEDDIDLEKKMIDHLKREHKDLDNKPTQILTSDSFEYRIDIDELFGNKAPVTKEIPTEDSVDYTVRTDYRKGAGFTHKQYGEGTIATTSAGSGGKGDTNGRLDWVDVDFKKPFLKGGVLTTIRRIAPVYTKVYFDTHKKK